MLAASAPSPPSLVSAVRGGLGAPASARGSRDSPLSAERGLPSEVNALCAAPRQTLGRGPSEAKISQERPQRRHRVRVKPSVPPSQGSDPSSEGGLRPQSVYNPLVLAATFWFTHKSTVNESHIYSGGTVLTTFDGSSHLRKTLRYPLGISLGYFLWYNPLGYIPLGICLNSLPLFLFVYSSVVYSSD